MRKVRCSMIASAVVFAPSLVGCAVGPTAPQDPTPPDGLSVLESGTTAGTIRGSYARDGHVVYFETLRGRELAEEYRNDPDAPAYEIDARFMDASGDVFLTQMGGDSFLDPTWTLGGENAHVIDPEIRVSDFRLAAEAAVELDRIAALEPRSEIVALRQLAASVAEEDLIMPAERRLRTLGDHYHHEYQIRTKSIWYTFGQGEHSAIRWHSYYSNSGTAAYSGYSCNHGHCAPGMNMKCKRISGARGRSTPTWFQSENKENTGVSGGCLTPYDALSKSGHHNCNDDTDLQMYNIVYKTKYDPYTFVGNDGACGDSSSNNNATGCIGTDYQF